MPFTSQSESHDQPAEVSIAEARLPRASASGSDLPPVTRGSRQRSNLRHRGLGMVVMSAGAAGLLLGFRAPGLAATTAASLQPLASPCPTPAAMASGIPGASPVATGSPSAPIDASAAPCTTDVASPSPSATAPAAVEQVLTGQVVQTQFGDVQVQITAVGTQITDVQALRLPNDRQYSAEISNYVAPYLRQMALKAQSAQIDLISGATYTSDGYARSLQSAIDQIAAAQ